MNEIKAWKTSGFLGLLVILLLYGGCAYFAIAQIVGERWSWTELLLCILLFLSASFGASGLTVVQPNQASVLTFFGRYLGSVRESGFWLVAPLTSHRKVSLRVRNFNSKQLKVNDVEGNPVEIAAVVVFRVVDTAKAVFEVDNYEQFVEIQSETALRHVATRYPYDTFEDESGYSLRGNAEEVAAELAQELQERLAVAGVEVLEARLTHLAYSPEIAGAMLQRQQAAAIIAARQRIVEGAVGMVQMAISRLEQDNLVSLDEERKCLMVNNLLVAIVSERAAQPVINVGSLY